MKKEKMIIDQAGILTINRNFIEDYEWKERGGSYEISGDIKCHNLEIEIPLFFVGNIFVVSALRVGDSVYGWEGSAFETMSSVVSCNKPRLAKLHVIGKIEAKNVYMHNYVSLERAFKK